MGRKSAPAGGWREAWRRARVGAEMMKLSLKKVRRAGSIIALTIVCVVIVAITLTVGWRPIIGAKARPLTNRRFEPTLARFERGKYLVESVAGCFECHSSGAGKGGGKVFGEGAVAPNITPDAETGAGVWTDDQLARAIREGIGHDGRAMTPLMPYWAYRKMSDEDLASIVTYLRALEPVRNQLPPAKLPVPLKLLSKILPEPVTAPVAAPDATSPAKRGEYFVELAHCVACHTPRTALGLNEKLKFAGGADVEGVTSANITPDPSGISYYDEALFVKTMRTGHVGARPLKPIMPWKVYGNMSDEDLKAVFTYLRTLKPVKHLVDNTEPPTDCKLCGYKHGLGERN
ncbi:MAG TPA: c-type cytochrome [Pyrinomonadaceae bacterium]|nr:c-type cytochrome [Pyrinomonadaceae bacterium]